MFLVDQKFFARFVIQQMLIDAKDTNKYLRARDELLQVIHTLSNYLGSLRKTSQTEVLLCS